MSHFPKGGKAGPHSLHTAEAWDHWGFGQAWGGAFWGRERFLWKSFGQVIETVQHSQWDCCIERRTWTDKLDWRVNRKKIVLYFYRNAISVLWWWRLSGLVAGRDFLSGCCECCQSSSNHGWGKWIIIMNHESIQLMEYVSAEWITTSICALKGLSAVGRR